jgi:uncharacterized OsmC-like protein
VGVGMGVGVGVGVGGRRWGGGGGGGRLTPHGYGNAAVGGCKPIKWYAGHDVDDEPATKVA